MKNQVELRQSVRRLLLPMRADSEIHCIQAMQSFFLEEGIAADDYLNWISLELGKWRDSGHLSEGLTRAVKMILSAADENVGPKLSSKWQRIYSKLTSDHFMGHEEARAFLSHSFLIIDLAGTDKLSAAQISNLLSQRDHRAKFSRQNVFDFLDLLDYAPTLSPVQIKGLFEQDKMEELPVFADADIYAAAEIVANEGGNLGFPGDLGSALCELYAESEPSRYTPYLQMLHYQCCVAEYYDHAVTDLYEFTPRGQAARWLLEQYPASLANAGNPFLNNAKSVESVSSSWVRTKKAAERPGAARLFEILLGLEAMGFAARQELARFIRLWIHRVIRLSLPLEIELPNRLGEKEWGKLLAFVTADNTRSFGILEQRVVDAIAASQHPEGSGWRSRGLGASVNTTNMSQHKIGDCDFQDPKTCSLRAYEAHGGRLSLIYVQEHLRTMSKIMPERAKELAGIADLSEWNTEVVFIAHDFEPAMPLQHIISDIKIKISYESYKDIIARTFGGKIPVSHLNDWVLSPLREARTPSEVRKAILTAIA